MQRTEPLSLTDTHHPHRQVRIEKGVPMLIQVGSYEMLLSDSVDVAAKAREQGVKVRISIYEGMFHIFQMAAKMLPESKRAWVEIGKFIDVLLND